MIRQFLAFRVIYTILIPAHLPISGGKTNEVRGRKESREEGI